MPTSRWAGNWVAMRARNKRLVAIIDQAQQSAELQSRAESIVGELNTLVTNLSQRLQELSHE